LRESLRVTKDEREKGIDRGSESEKGREGERGRSMVSESENRRDDGGVRSNTTEEREGRPARFLSFGRNSKRGDIIQKHAGGENYVKYFE
jgi:hypothetical protein